MGDFTSKRGRKGSIPDDEFIEMFERLGLSETARQLGLRRENVSRRRKVLEGYAQRQIMNPNPSPNPTPVGQRCGIQHPQRVTLEVTDGVVLVGSDGHYWPGAASTAHRAFVRFCEWANPKVVVLNGDAFDGARISRHPPIGWEGRPEVVDELGAVQERLKEIEDAAPEAALAWNLGNHDGRFETRLATMAPEFAKIEGFHLKDHFNERWRPAWSTWINDDVVIKHRFKGGLHAPHNNTLWAGRTMVTGHLHSAKVQPITDYNGTRWGVDTGCLADPWGPQFTDYTEDNPKNWIAGFAVLTFVGGRLLPPELATVWGPNSVVFRGEITEV